MGSRGLGNEMQRQGWTFAETSMHLVAQRLATRDEVAEFINRRGRFNE